MQNIGTEQRLNACILEKQTLERRTSSRRACRPFTEVRIDTWALQPMLRMRSRMHSCPHAGI